MSFNESEVRRSAFDDQVGGGHYKRLAIQPIEYCQRNNLGACESFVVKYVTRWREKGGINDLAKAIHCIELLIEMEGKKSETPIKDLAIKIMEEINKKD